MAEIVQANWLLIVGALVIGLLVAWWIFVASRRTTVQLEDTDDSEGKPAKRNQALIDAPPAARKDADLPAGKVSQAAEIAASAASPGPASAAANTDATAAAPLGTDAEAGDGTPMAAALNKTPAPAATPSGGDDLTRIKGVGPKLVALLHDMDVRSFADIAAWSDADIDRVDAQLGRFQGRIRRDNWVEQARLLQTGDKAAYEAKFGRTS